MLMIFRMNQRRCVELMNVNVIMVAVHNNVWTQKRVTIVSVRMGTVLMENTHVKVRISNLNKVDM